MLKGKIHRAVVKQAELNYVGSITVDPELMEAAGILEYERVHIVDAENVMLSVTDLYGYAEKYGMSGSDNYVLGLGIDTAYPAKDVLYSGFERYQTLQPIAWIALMALTLANIL